MILDNPAELREAVPAGMRLMGLDVGTKTIGIALSDTRRIIATPLETIRRHLAADAFDIGLDAHVVGSVVIANQVTIAASSDR